MALFDDDAVEAMKGQLKTFLAKSQEKKNAIYKDIFNRSIAAVGLGIAFGAVPQVIGLFWEYQASWGPFFTTAYILALALALVGGAALAIIPVDKFNLDDWERSSPSSLRVYIAIRAVLAASAGLYGLFYFWNGPELMKGTFLAPLIAFALCMAVSVAKDFLSSLNVETSQTSGTATPPPQSSGTAAPHPQSSGPATPPLRAPSLLLSDCVSGTITFVLLMLTQLFLIDAAAAVNTQNYFRQFDHYMFSVGYFCTFLFVCGRRVCGYTKVDALGSEIKGWRSRAALDTLLALLFGIGASFLVEEVAAFSFTSSSFCNPSCVNTAEVLSFRTAFEMVGRIAFYFAVWSPVLLLFGSLQFESVRTLLFRVLAEWWGMEGVSVRQRAGAQLAAATNILVRDTKAKVYWIKRKSEDKVKALCGQPNCILRNHWMPGHIDEDSIVYESTKYGGEVSACRTFAVRIYYRQDTAKEWFAQFVGQEVVFSGGAFNFFNPLASVSSESDENVYAWRNFNFDTETPVRRDGGHGPYVLIKVQAQTARQPEITRNTLQQPHDDEDMDNHYLNWARTHFRAFALPSAGSFGDMLTVSPRDAKDQNKKFWEASEHVSVTSDSEKLAYFISHSWDDVKAASVNEDKIKHFDNIRMQAPDGKIWFDQACLVKWGKCSNCGKDCSPAQACPAKGKECQDCGKDCNPEGMSFATLPISVGNCKKLLVMLSPTYLSRLWCIMELFSVFAFAIPEVAVARIDIVRVLGADASSHETALDDFKRDISAWSLDQAHCFDPNEEFKIRRVAYAIGEDEILKCVRSLASCRFVQLDRVPWWRRLSLPSWLQLSPTCEESDAKSEHSDATQRLLPKDEVHTFSVRGLR